MPPPQEHQMDYSPKTLLPVDHTKPGKTIGSIIRESHNLTADQVEKVLEHQRQTGLRFGESAVALGYVKREQVLWALSQQFEYPYDGNSIEAAELFVGRTPFSEHAEVFRELRSQLIAGVFSGQQGPVPKALAVVSPDSGDGKTFFAANLAAVFSQLSGRVVLVDADLRGPRMHELFGLRVEAGLSGALVGHTEIKVVRPVAALPNLFLLPAGVVPPNPLELLERPAFSLVLDELRSQFDHVIVDTSAASTGAIRGSKASRSWMPASSG